MNYLCSWTRQPLLAAPPPTHTHTAPDPILPVLWVLLWPIIALNALAVTLENPAQPGGSVAICRVAACCACRPPPAPHRHAQWRVHTWVSLPTSLPRGGGTKQPLSFPSGQTLLLLLSSASSSRWTASASFPPSLFPVAESNPACNLDEDHLFKSTNHNLE